MLKKLLKLNLIKIGIKQVEESRASFDQVQLWTGYSLPPLAMVFRPFRHLKADLLTPNLAIYSLA